MAKTGVTPCSKCALFSAAIFGPWLAAGGQAYRKHRALAHLARDGHVATHHARELAGDGKAKAQPAGNIFGVIKPKMGAIR